MPEQKQGYKNSLIKYNAIFDKDVKVTEIDTQRSKTGDGKTPWNDLPYDDGDASN